MADSITETTLAELGEPGGVGAGCTGTADPNSIVGGLEPINIASGDVVFSGTARAGVTAVSVTVGGLGAREAVVTPGPVDSPSTWTLTVSKADLAPLPDGNVAVTPTFGTLAGTTKTVLKDTVAPLAPTPSVPAGTYGAPQSVALNKPDGETTSKVYWEIGNTAVPDPNALSNLYTAQISVTSTQTLKGRLIDAAGNPGAVGTFDYRIGTPPAAPTNLAGGETTPAGSARLTWSPAAGAAGYNVYRNGVKLNTTLLTATSYTHTGAGLGDHNYTVRAAEAQGIESFDSNPITVTIAAPAVPTGLRATPGDARATLNWTAVTGAASYRVYRDDVVVANSVAGTSYINTGLTNGNLYAYDIASLDASGNESARSGFVQVSPQVPADTTPPPAPAVTPATGAYTAAQTVKATNTEAGVTHRYTVATGTTAPADPTATSPELPAAGLPVDATSVVKVASFDAAGNGSQIVSRTITIDAVAPPAPSVIPATGTYTSNQTVTATNTEAGVTHRYTVGTGTTVPADPTTASTTLPAAGLPVSASSIVKVASFDAAGNRSTVVQRNYTINAPATGGTRTVTLTAAADTFVRQNATVNAGTIATGMKSDSESTTGNTASRDTSYVRFPAPTLATGETVTGAVLKLNVSNGSANGPLIYRTASTWTETGMTYTTGRPTRSSTTAVANIGNAAVTSALNVPITGVTGAAQSFELFAESSDGFDFTPRESTTPPQLVLTIQTGSATPPADTVAPPAPSVNPATGTYTSNQTVTATNTEAGVTHRYTVGTGTTVPADPTTASTTLPAAGLPVSASSIVKVASFDAAGNRSTVVQRNYTINAPATGGTRTVTLTAAADTFVRQNATVNAGTIATGMKSDSESTTGNTASRDTSYVRFPAPTLATGETVTGAVLKLNVSNGSANGPLIYRTASTWTETGMTYTTGRPTRSSTTAVANIGNAAVTSALNVPITGVTGAAQSFELFAESSDGFDFTPRESTTPPQLVLTIRTP